MTYRWQDHAACNGEDPAAFDVYTYHGNRALRVNANDVARALLTCDRCPVRSPCHFEALINGDSGVRGGQLLNINDTYSRQVRRIYNRLNNQTTNPYRRPIHQTDRPRQAS